MKSPDVLSYCALHYHDNHHALSISIQFTRPHATVASSLTLKLIVGDYITRNLVQIQRVLGFRFCVWPTALWNVVFNVFERGSLFGGYRVYGLGSKLGLGMR